MGVHIPNLAFLLKFKGRSLGATLLLGRQGLHISDDPASEEYQYANALMRRYDPNISLDDVRSDGFTEKLFAYLGSLSVRSLDFSNYEGAEIVHDLNMPVPSELKNQYDCIFDGGTLEHIFDLPQALRNITEMLKIGGIFLSTNGANNFLGHGFYQFSPELMWRAFSLEKGFQIELMQLVDESSTPKPTPVIDPALLGRRDEIRITHGCTLLQVAARKVRHVANVPIQQSDYVRSE